MKAKIIRVLLICMIPLAVYGNAAGETYGDNVRHAIEISSLSQEQKDGLLDVSNKALKAGIPAPDVALIVRRGLDRGWSDKSLKETLSLLVNTNQQGLPTEQVLDRFYQGASKGVPFEKVSFAAKRLIKNLSTADGLVDNLMRGGLTDGKGKDRAKAVGTVARALETSIPEEEIMNIGSKLVKDRHSLSRFNAAVSAMTSFTEMGVPMEYAVRLTNKAVDRGYSEEEMVKMEMNMARGIKDGIKYEDMMRNMESVMGGSGMSGMGSGPGMHGVPGSPGGSGSGMGGGSGSGMGGGMGDRPGGMGGRHGM
jgi:hypothetical protein